MPPRVADSVRFSQQPARREPGNRGDMKSPFKGWPSWVVGFLKSPEGGVNCIFFRTAGAVLDAVFNPENAIQPRIDTDGHGYQAVAQKPRLTQKVSQTRSLKSVFIRVHPWLMTSSSDSNCGIWVQWRRIMKSRHSFLRLGILPSAAQITDQRQLALRGAGLW